MKKTTGFVFGVLLVACGADMADISAEMVADAGQLLSDAGQALTDAGKGADSTADAQPPATTMSLACTVKREYKLGQLFTPEFFATFDVSAERIRTAWVCDRRTAGSPWVCPGESCTGTVPPNAKCEIAAFYEAADGRVWVHCGEQFQNAKLVLD